MIIKTEEEREILREGGRRLGAILHKTSLRARVGISLKELNTYAQELMDEYEVKPSFLGYGNPPFPGVVCISVNDGVVHGIPGDYVLKDGDMLTLDGGVWHEGLCTDAAITIGVGNVSKEDLELAAAAKEAMEAQITAAVVGNTTGDIGYASEQVAKKYGYGFPNELGGHGVGREVHEKPFVPTSGERGTGTTLEEGMVLALEPILVSGKGRVKIANDAWLYQTVDGSRSAQFEHTVIVGKESAEVLTAHNE